MTFRPSESELYNIKLVAERAVNDVELQVKLLGELILGLISDIEHLQERLNDSN